MFDPKIKLSKVVYDKARRAAELSGCSTIEEYIEKIVERDADRVLSQSGNKTVSQEEVDNIANQLKGLGYLE